MLCQQLTSNNQTVFLSSSPKPRKKKKTKHNGSLKRGTYGPHDPHPKCWSSNQMKTALASSVLTVKDGNQTINGDSSMHEIEIIERFKKSKSRRGEYKENQFLFN